MKRWLALAAVLAACTTNICTAVGCASGLRIAGALAGMNVCLDDVCEPFVSNDFFIDFPSLDERAKSHVLTVGLSRYEGPITFTKFQPNGSKCPPRCWQAAFTLNADGTLTPS